MIGRILDLVYGAVPADFESAYGLEETVMRLSAATHRSIGEIPHEAAVGRVSKHRVALRRVRPSSSNAFKPFYIGRFRQVKGRVVLTGRFTPALMPKLFMTSWLAFCLLLAVLAARPLWQGGFVPWQPLFAGTGLFVAGVAAVVLCKRLARADIPWLSAVIQDALGTPTRTRTVQRGSAPTIS